MFGELRVAFEAVHAGDLGDELGGCQGSAAAQGKERCCLPLDERTKLPLELPDPCRQLTATGNEFGCDPHLRRLRAACEQSLEPLKPTGAVERPGRHDQIRFEIVQVPAQPALDPRPLSDEIIVVVEQQLDLTLPPGQERLRKPGLTQASTGDGKSVDPIGLARRANALAARAHQPRRYPHDPLPTGEQEPLEREREVDA